MKRITKMQRLHETPYDAGERHGRNKERARILRLLRARVDPYDDDCPIRKAIRRITR